MKQFTFSIFILLLMLILFSCSKDKSPVAVEDNNVSIFGKWLWTESSGGFSGGTIYPPANKKFVVQFTPDSNYYEYNNDTLVSSMRYSIKKQWAPGIFPNIDSVDAIIWNSRPNALIRYLTKDSLILWQMCADCYTINYIKLSH